MNVTLKAADPLNAFAQVTVTLNIIDMDEAPTFNRNAIASLDTVIAENMDVGNYTNKKDMIIN